MDRTRPSEPGVEGACGEVMRERAGSWCRRPWRRERLEVERKGGDRWRFQAGEEEMEGT